MQPVLQEGWLFEVCGFTFVSQHFEHVAYDILACTLWPGVLEPPCSCCNEDVCTETWMDQDRRDHLVNMMRVASLLHVSVSQTAAFQPQ